MSLPDPATTDHDRALASAFDGQAERFERAPVQSDPDALRRLVAFADLPPGSHVLDAGCGPGLVAEAFYEAGHIPYGIDLSAEMVRRARQRLAERPFRGHFWFQQANLFNPALFRDRERPFDAAYSRYVVHHQGDPLAFLRRQVELIRPGGVVVACDHTTDPDPARAAWHQDIEKARDVTHTANPTPGQLADLLAAAGLGEIRLIEEAFTLDFDEWYDRGTPDDTPKAEIRRRLLEGPQARGFTASERPDGGATIACWRALVRGIKPETD